MLLVIVEPHLLGVAHRGRDQGTSPGERLSRRQPRPVAADLIRRGITKVRDRLSRFGVGSCQRAHAREEHRELRLRVHPHAIHVLQHFLLLRRGVEGQESSRLQALDGEPRERSHVA
jgi:hypothetical protein